VFTPDGRPLGQARDEMTSAAVVEKWEDLKAQERTAVKASTKTILSGVPKTLPALLRAYELSSRAAAVGFDWETATDVLAKIEEEVAEVRQEVERQTPDPRRVEEEIGDVFFALANLSRKLGVEPEAALRAANAKFQERFEGMERDAGKRLRELTLAELERLWQAQKAR
jgi:MazG family protein